MIDPTLLYEVARLQQRDVEKEVAQWQIANQVKATSPGVMIGFLRTCEVIFKKIVVRQNQESSASEEPLVLNITYES